MNRADVGMSKGGGSTGFVEQILTRGLVKANVLLNDFQGHFALQDIVVTPIDDPHSPFPNLGHYAVATEDPTDHRVLLPHAIRVHGENGSKLC